MNQKMAQQLRPSKSASKKPKIDWSRREEADNFAHTVKLYRQGKIDHDNFRRFRLQHGAYGTRMTDDYAMVRIKIPAGQIYPYQLEKIAEFNDKAEKIAEMFWPGPITLILKVKDENIKKSLGLGKKIAVRVPNNQCVLSLLKECKLLVATSANISGTTSLTDPNDCKRDLNGYDLLLDGGILSDDGESTIVEIDRNKLRIVRSGSISEEELKKLF